MDWQSIWLSVRLASATTAVLLALGLPIAYWLTFSARRWKFLVEALVALPLVLPPTVLGFYVLLAIGPRSPIGAVYARLTGGLLPFFYLPPVAILMGSALALGVGILSGILPALSAMRLRVVEAMRRV